MFHGRIDARVSIARPRVAPVWCDGHHVACSSARRRRGLTLLEILIVLTLIIATAAIAIPAMTERFENTRFDSTIDQVVATLALARAESQRERRPVQVMWDPAQRVVYVTWLDQKSLNGEGDANTAPTSEEDQANADQLSSTQSNSDGGLSAAEQLNTAAEGAKAIWTGGSRLRVILPEGCRVRIGTEESEQDAPPLDGSILPPPRDVNAAQLSDQATSLIVYMPDGSTFGQASFMIMDEAGRKSRIDVNPWTGQAVVTRIEMNVDGPATDESTADASPSSLLPSPSSNTEGRQ